MWSMDCLDMGALECSFCILPPPSPCAKWLISLAGGRSRLLTRHKHQGTTSECLPRAWDNASPASLAARRIGTSAPGHMPPPPLYVGHLPPRTSAPSKYRTYKSPSLYLPLASWLRLQAFSSAIRQLRVRYSEGPNRKPNCTVGTAAIGIAALRDSRPVLFVIHLCIGPY